MFCFLSKRDIKREVGREGKRESGNKGREEGGKREKVPLAFWR